MNVRSAGGCRYRTRSYARGASEAAMTTLRREPVAASRRTPTRLARGRRTDLGHPLQAVLEDVADGNYVVILRPTQEITPAEAARVLGVTRQFVDRLCANGVLPFRRLPASRHRRISSPTCSRTALARVSAVDCVAAARALRCFRAPKLDLEGRRARADDPERARPLVQRASRDRPLDHDSGAAAVSGPAAGGS